MGRPTRSSPINCPDVYDPIQIWFYERLEALQSKTYLIFYQPMGMGDYKLWQPLDGVYVLQAGGVGGIGGATMSRHIDVTQCADWQTLQQAMSYEMAAMGSGPLR